MRSLTKKQIIFNKFDGHCSYCGCILLIEYMHIDHLIPKSYAYSFDANGNKIINREQSIKLGSIDNLVPACKECNTFKSDLNIEDFRNKIVELSKNYHKDISYNICKKYAIINSKDSDIINDIYSTDLPEFFCEKEPYNLRINFFIHKLKL